MLARVYVFVNITATSKIRMSMVCLGRFDADRKEYDKKQ